MAEIIDVNTMFGPLPAAAADLGVDELQGMMRKHGVRAACTLSTIGVLLDHNAGNAATRAACQEQPSLIPVATVNPLSYFGGEGPHTRFASDGFKMVRFFPCVQGWEVDSAAFVALAGQLKAEALPLMVDVPRPGVPTRLLRALGDYPAAVLLHGLTEQSVAEAVALMRDHPRLYVSTASLTAQGAIKQVADSVGANRVLYGSAAPSHPMASALGTLKHAGLPDDQRDQILGANARQLFKL